MKTSDRVLLLLRWLAEDADLTQLDDVGPETAAALREALRAAADPNGGLCTCDEHTLDLGAEHRPGCPQC